MFKYHTTIISCDYILHHNRINSSLFSNNFVNDHGTWWVLRNETNLNLWWKMSSQYKRYHSKNDTFLSLNKIKSQCCFLFQTFIDSIFVLNNTLNLPRGYECRNNIKSKNKFDQPNFWSLCGINSHQFPGCSTLSWFWSP